MAIRKKRAFLIAGAVILLVIVVIIVVALVGIKAFKPQIQAAASSALGMDVHIGGGMSVSFFPGFGASLTDISVKNGGVDVATIAKMKIGLKLFPLIRRRVEITRLELIKPVIAVAPLIARKANAETPGGKGPGNPVTVKRLILSQGNLNYEDAKSGGKIELEGVNIALGDVSVGGPEGTDPMKTIAFTGEIRCRKVTTKTIALANLSMRIKAGNGVFDADPVRMEIFGGAGRGTVRADFTGPSPDFRVSYALSRLRIEDLLQESPRRKNMEGLADFSAGLAARGKTEAELERSLNGQVTLDGENILLNGIDLDAILASLERSQNFNLVDLGGFFLAGPLGTALTKGYNFAGVLGETHGGKGVIRRLVSVWKVGNGVAEAADVALATSRHRVAVKGGLNFIDDRFEDVTVAVIDPRGCAVFSQKIHGRFGHPQIDKLNLLQSLTGPMTNLLGSMKKFVASGKCQVFYSGSVAPPEGTKEP